MQVVSLGLIAPATGGTPQQVTADLTIKARKIIVTQVPGTSGNTFFGTSGMSRTTPYAGVVRAFPPASTSGVIDEFILESDDGNALYPANFYVDAATNGQGLIISYVVG